MGDCIGFQQVDVRQLATLDKWHDLDFLCFPIMAKTSVVLSMSPPRRARTKVSVAL
jgi:hypothetical protein